MYSKPETKTPEELQREMYEKLLKSQGTGEFLTEVAMPGIGLPVNPKDLEK